MIRLASRALLFWSLSTSAAATPRVVLVSWDGAGYAMTSRLLDEGRMPNLARVVREGAWTDGMVSTFPTKTAAAHATLFTGHFGHTSGITGNAVLALPKEEHDRLDTQNGYFSTPLEVDPVWVRVAREGGDAYVFHATQAFPFDAAARDLSADELRHLFLIHGYTDVQARAETWTERTVPLAFPDGWAVPEARGAEARSFRFTVGESSYWGLFFDDPFDATVGVDTLGVVVDPTATEFEARVGTGADGSFSLPIRARVRGTDVWFSLRVFEASPTADRFIVYRSGAVELALSNSRTPMADLPALQVFAGNGGGFPYSHGELGPRRRDGGDGLAEERFYETLAHLQDQIVRQASVALAQDYSLAVLYSPVSDDSAHELAGFVDPSLDDYDEGLAVAYWEDIARAFELQDRLLGVVLDAAEKDGAHVVLVSDHGMAGTNRLVHVNVALARAGLLTLDANGSIDLSATQALAPPLGDTSIAVNTVDRAGGIVPLEERDTVLRRVREVLSALTDPETGQPIVTAFFEPARHGLLQPGGDSTGDLFLDYAPGYYPTETTTASVVVQRTEPRGNHIFVPTRRDMLSICAAWGPRIEPGTNWGRVRAVDIVPTVLDLLDLEIPAALPGRSLVPARVLLDSARAR